MPWNFVTQQPYSKYAAASWPASLQISRTRSLRLSAPQVGVGVPIQLAKAALRVTPRSSTTSSSLVLDVARPVHLLKPPTERPSDLSLNRKLLYGSSPGSLIGGVGMWSVIVVLPAVQAEFGVARSAASLPYTMTMICFGFGGILMGRLSDRFGIFVPVVGGAISLELGYALASQATSLGQFILAHGLLVGVASSVTFAPILADTSLWFTRRRGMAVAIIARGSYLAGTVWPPVVQHFTGSEGWRRTYLGIAAFCVATMLPLALILRRRSPLTEAASATSPAVARSSRPLGMSRGCRPC